jgi:hypothetical protein
MCFIFIYFIIIIIFFYIGKLNRKKYGLVKLHFFLFVQKVIRGVVALAVTSISLANFSPLFFPSLLVLLCSILDETRSPSQLLDARAVLQAEEGRGSPALRPCEWLSTPYPTRSALAPGFDDWPVGQV